MTFYSSELLFDDDVFNYDPILPNIPDCAMEEYATGYVETTSSRLLPPGYYDHWKNWKKIGKNWKKLENLPQPYISSTCTSAAEATTERLKVDLPILSNITKSARKHPVFHFTLNKEVYVMERKHAATYTLSLKCVNQPCDADWKIIPNAKIIIYATGKKKQIQLDRSNPSTFHPR